MVLIDGALIEALFYLFFDEMELFLQLYFLLEVLGYNNISWLQQVVFVLLELFLSWILDLDY